MKRASLLVLTLVLLVNLVGWTLVPPQVRESHTTPFHEVKGFSYAPFRPGQSPITGVYPTAEQIDQDMAILSQTTTFVRTYGATKGLELVPKIAKKHHLRVAVGAWLDRNLANNNAEIEGAINAANANGNVDLVIVGNEAILRGDFHPPKASVAAATTQPSQAAATAQPSETNWRLIKKGPKPQDAQAIAEEQAEKAATKAAIKELAKYIERVKKHVYVPVTTAEPHHIWLENPELVEAVDVITVHLLPYWEGKSIDESVDHVVGVREALHAKYPNKRIIIGEVGWPSGGEFRRGAVPSPWNQERFVRQFVQIASKNSYEYFICEAFDQPWKAHLGQDEGGEGTVGAYWGMFTAERKLKFAWDKPAKAGVPLLWQWALSTGVGLIFVGWFLLRRRDVAVEGLIFFGLMIQAAASVSVFTGLLPLAPWLTHTAKLMWFLLFPAQLFMLSIMLIQAFEVAELVWVKKFRRKFRPEYHAPERANWPKVSLHVACCNEPPAMVIKTIESLARQDYPNLEVLVIDNNTKDPRKWEPVRDACERLGERFRFFHLDPWPGFKAGALNFAMEQTAPDAEIVGVIDADYVIETDWLRSVVGHFDDQQVGLVQAPQAHRGWSRNAFKEMINWEYEGFFHLGMVHRNEYDAIIQHGTMCLMRKTAMDKIGRWATWCIVEDAELGMRLMQHGYKSVYVNHAFGRGLVPDSFMAYKKQRFRWAYGSVQILRGHWKSMLPNWLAALVAPRHHAENRRTGHGLTAWQKYHFIAGWLPWFGDAMHLLFTILLLAGSAALIFLPRHVMMPVAAFLIPSLALSVFSLARSLWLYMMRVNCDVLQRVSASIAGLGLTYTIGMAMITGLVTMKKPFFRTPKCEKMSALGRCLAMARDELTLLVLLWAALGGIVWVRVWSQGLSLLDSPQSLVWVLSLAFQSVPYAAAVTCSLIGGLPDLTLDSLRSGQRRTGVLARRVARRLEGIPGVTVTSTQPQPAVVPINANASIQQ